MRVAGGRRLRRAGAMLEERGIGQLLMKTAFGHAVLPWIVVLAIVPIAALAEDKPSLEAIDEVTLDIDHDGNTDRAVLVEAPDRARCGPLHLPGGRQRKARSFAKADVSQEGPRRLAATSITRKQRKGIADGQIWLWGVQQRLGDDPHDRQSRRRISGRRLHVTNGTRETAPALATSTFSPEKAPSRKGLA